MENENKMRSIFVCVAVLLLIVGASHLAYANDFQESGKKSTMSDYKGPQDTPRIWGSEIEKLRQPYIDEAIKTYPNAKARFHAGLPIGYRFFVTVDLREYNIHENAFMAVSSISEGQITATIATKLIKVKSYQYGQELTFPESKVLDWTITSPDGKEEGNYIGKFLDEYYRKHP